MTITLIIAGILLFTIVPLPGGSAVDRIIKFRHRKEPPALCDLQERALTDPLLLEALRETDAVLPDSLPIEPREKLAEIAAEEAKIAEEKKFLQEQERVRAEARAAEGKRVWEAALLYEEQKRHMHELLEAQERARAEARLKAAVLASSPEIPAISHRGVTVVEVEKQRIEQARVWQAMADQTPEKEKDG